jgi:hypothetical protein
VAKISYQGVGHIVALPDSHGATRDSVDMKGMSTDVNRILCGKREWITFENEEEEVCALPLVNQHRALAIKDSA